MKTLIPNRVGYLKSGLAYLLPDVSGSVVRVGFSTPSLEGTIIIQKIPCYRLSEHNSYYNDSFLILIAVNKSIGLQKLSVCIAFWISCDSALCSLAYKWKLPINWHWLMAVVFKLGYASVLPLYSLCSRDSGKGWTHHDDRPSHLSY